MLFTILAALTVVALFLFVLAQPIRTRVKLAATTAALGFFIALVGLHAELPGTARSVMVETANVPQAKVLWSGTTDDRIYLLLYWRGLEAPRYYWMPKTKQRARQLRQAKTKARAQRRPLMVREPFKKFRTDQGTVAGKKPGQTRPGRGQHTADNDGDNRGVFYASPPRPLPIKR